jgi:DNA (cytosine-5)-methyltransferase 1
MALGFRRAGIEFDLAVDQDPDACESYARNMGERPVQLDAADLLRMARTGWRPAEQVGLLVADPPCTPWSRAGKRKGLNDARDMLRTTVALIAELQPTCWVLGNVPGLDDEPNWPVVQKLIGTIPGYCVDYTRIDAADFGVPQHRVRPFWFGHPALSTECIRWPSPTHGDPDSIGHAELGDRRKPWVTCRQALAHLTVEELGKPVRVRWTSESYAPSRIDEPGKGVPASRPGNRGAVLSLGRGDHQPSEPDKPARTMTRNPLGDGALLAHPKHPINRPDAPSCTVTARDTGGAQGACAIEWPWDRPSTTVFAGTAQTGGPGKGSPGSRANAVTLSERAATILQGFPEDWHFAGKTKRARWSQLGQAMPPPLAEAVANQVARWLAARAREAA